MAYSIPHHRCPRVSATHLSVISLAALFFLKPWVVPTKARDLFMGEGAYVRMGRNGGSLAEGRSSMSHLQLSQQALMVEPILDHSKPQYGLGSSKVHQQ